MAGIVPGRLITAPEPIGRRYGLLSAAAGPIDLPPHGAGGGVRYVPVSCGEAHAWPIECTGEAVVSTAKQGDPGDELVEANPFAVYASYECGSVGYTPREFTDKVLRRLANGEQGAVEYSLWTGNSDVGGVDLGISNFQDDASAITVADDSDLASVVSAMEEWAYFTMRYGNVAYIHAPVSMAAWFGTNHLIRFENGLYKTDFGSIIVFGGGYPGTGANGEAAPVGGAYMHITGQTTVYRSAEPFVYPVPQTLDKSTNQYFLLAEREYAVAFDCMVGRALFNPLGGS
jgi:hypothetical protein